MAVNPFVRALSLCHFEDFAYSQGLKADDMLRRSSLPLELLRRQEGILSYRRFCALLELCARESGNSLYGLQYGLHQGVSIFGPLLYLIRNADTVGEALKELRQNYSLQNGAAEVGFEIEGSLAMLSYHISDQELTVIAQAEELAVSIGIQLMRTLVGSHWQPGAVLLSHLPLAEPAAYRRTLGFLPTFSANYSGLMFDAAVLALPLAASDQMLHGLIAQHIECMERLTPDELPNYVRQLLRNLLPSGRVTIEKVADCMALNPRTLQRKLAQEGTAFQVLLDQTRQHLAQHYLEDASISVAQMAGLLGYADLTAFCRAFHRWFGVPPREWKKRQHPGLQPRLLRSRHLRALR